MTKWLKRIGAVFLALAAIVYGLRARHHMRGHSQKLDRVQAAKEAKGAGSAAALAEQRAAEVHIAATMRDLKKAEAAIDELKDRTDEPFAQTVDRINARLSGRVSDND